MKRRLLIFSCIVLFACNSTKTDKKINQDESNSKVEQESIEKDSTSEKENKLNKWFSVYGDSLFFDSRNGCNIWIEYVDSFNLKVFPFELDKTSIEEIRNHFIKEIGQDSIKLDDGNGIFYRFYDKNSCFDFNIYEGSISVDRGIVRGNILNFKNGIKIGMHKSEFNALFKIAENNCDTLRIGVGIIGNHYNFIFKEDTLNKIIFWTEYP